MKRFISKHTGRSSAIPTAALPDIIFMLLFFFMVSTVVREKEEKIAYMVPKAVQQQKIEKKSLVTTINIGIPKNVELYGTEPVIEAGGKIMEVKDVVQFVFNERQKLPDYNRDFMIILLKVDEEVGMGIVADVQQELRKANARRIVYGTNKKIETTTKFASL